MDSELDDPLKGLEQICKPDSRQAFFLGSLADNHADLSEMELHQGVPPAVRQLFETAKNLSLYSWFVYPFHQVSELIAYAALEFALRSRDGFVEFDVTNRNLPGLSLLLRRAKEMRWINNDRFPCRKWMAVERARHKLVIAAMPGLGDGQVQQVKEPTEAEVEQALDEIDVVQILVESAPKLRNALAHGSSMLHPNSRRTLRVVSEAINQLFQAADGDLSAQKG